MARPVKCRKIQQIPESKYFIPTNERKNSLEENILMYEEIEAIRLKDLEGLEQSECAERMEVSRPTFQRILLSAREKIADSIIYGKGISIEGGSFEVSCEKECKGRQCMKNCPKKRNR